jgi:predicted nucleic acid-binding protein
MLMSNANVPIFVDTAGWAEPVLQNTPDHQSMSAYADQLLASHRPLVTTNYIIVELVVLLTSRAHSMTRPDLMRFVNALTALPWLRLTHIDEATHAEAWALLGRATDKQWSLTDAASFVIMKQMGLSEAFTSGHHFEQAGFVRVP